MKVTDEISVNAQTGIAEASLLVREDAEFLVDHFPGAPMLPGLLMLEMAVRAASAWWEARRDGDPQFAAELEEVEDLRVVRRVVPKEALLVTTKLLSLETGRQVARFEASGSVAGETAMRARFRLRALA